MSNRICLPKLVSKTGAKEVQSVEKLLAKAKQDKAKKLQHITVHQELELEFHLDNLLASDRKPFMGLQCRDPHPEAELWALVSELWVLVRDNMQLLSNHRTHGGGTGSMATGAHHLPAAQEVCALATAAYKLAVVHKPQGHLTQEENHSSVG